MDERIQLVFAPNYGKKRTNLIKNNPQLMKEMDQSPQLIVEGSLYEQMIISTKNICFKLKGVNISTTMLVINQTGSIHQEGNSYMEVEIYEPPLEGIYATMLERSCMRTSEIEVDFLGEFGFEEEEFRKEVKITANQFQMVKEYSGLIQVEDRYMLIPLTLKAEVLRKLLSSLTKENLSTEWFSLQLINSLFPQLPQCFLHHVLLSTFFDFENKAYKLTTKTIYHFVLMQMAINKNEYSCFELNKFINELLPVYLPVGQGTEQQLLDEVTSQYFIRKKDVCVFYDPLQIDATVSGRLSFLTSIKKRWTELELKSVLRGFPLVDKGKIVQMQEFLLKKFRKYGNEYEIRFILPK